MRDLRRGLLADHHYSSRVAYLSRVAPCHPPSPLWVTLPLEIVRFKVLYLLAIWEGEATPVNMSSATLSNQFIAREGEAPAELLRHGSAGASPSQPINLHVPKPDDLSGRVGRKAGEGDLGSG